MSIESSFADEILSINQALKNFAAYLTKDNYKAEDLVQDTIFRALSNENKFKRGTNLKAWLYTINEKYLHH